MFRSTCGEPTQTATHWYGVPFEPDRCRSQARAYRDVAYLGVATPEVAAALRAAECADFHQQLSHRDEGRPLEGGVAVGHWTWGGALTGKREATLLAART